MIKNFESFFMSSRDDEPSFEDQLNSSIESKYPEIWSGHKEFFKKLNSLFSELPGSSYSNFAKADRRRGIDYRSEMVSKDIEDCMRDCRITWEEILGNKELIKKCIEVYSYISGYVDIILWRLDNSYNVGGWDDAWFQSEEGGEDIIIKYRYGYHDTTYGGIFIKRYFGNVENFINRVADELLKYFILNNNIISSKAIKELESENYIIHLGNNNFKIYFEDFYHLCLEHGIVDIKNIQNFGEIICNYFENLGMTEDNYEIEDDWSFIYLKLSQD